MHRSLQNLSCLVIQRTSTIIYPSQLQQCKDQPASLSLSNQAMQRTVIFIYPWPLRAIFLNWSQNTLTQSTKYIEDAAIILGGHKPSCPNRNTSILTSIPRNPRYRAPEYFLQHKGLAAVCNTNTIQSNILSLLPWEQHEHLLHEQLLQVELLPSRCRDFLHEHQSSFQ